MSAGSSSEVTFLSILQYWLFSDLMILHTHQN